MGFTGYVRVSRVAGREGDSFQSPAEQRSVIEGWAKSRGVEVTEFLEDFDVSGGTLSRPGLDAVMDRIRTGATDGVVVAKLNRLSRAGVADALKLCEEIYDAGAEVVAIDEGADPTTPAGKVLRTLMLAFAEMERENVKAGWRTARRRAVERGVFIGPVPLGFVKAGPGAPLVPGPDADRVRDLFQVSGSDGLDAAFAFARRTWPDRQWSVTVVRKMLANRVYRGDVAHGDIQARDVIEPIVSEMAFDFAQHPDTRAPRSAAATYPLSGIARCAECGGPMVGHKVGRAGRRKRSYRCTGEDCRSRPHIFADPLEEHVLDAVRAHPPHRGRTGDEVFRSMKAIVLARAEVDAWIENTSIGDLGAARWHQGMEAREARLAEAQAKHDLEREEHGDLPDLDDPTPLEMRAIFEATVATLTVRRGRESLPERVALTVAD